MFPNSSNSSGSSTEKDFIKSNFQYRIITALNHLQISLGVLPLGKCIELGKLDIGRPLNIPSMSRWQMLLVSELILTVFSDLLKSMDLIPEIRMYQSGNRYFLFNVYAYSFC